MPTIDVVRTEIEIAAPPERVFDALTDPRELGAWWGSDETYRTSDWQLDPTPGGEWSAHTVDADGIEGTLHGEVRVADAPHRLEYSWRASWDDGESVVRYELEPVRVGGAPGTRLTVTHTGPMATASAQASLGWQGVITCLAHDAALRRRSVVPSMHRTKRSVVRVVRA